MTTAFANSIAVGVLGAFILGFGVGGLHIIARLVWADYFGRLHLGAIRAWGLAAQVGGQALGPIAAGMAVDRAGSYQGAFMAFGINLAVVSLLMLIATRPGREAADGGQRITPTE
jgi:MFS family permease